MNKKFILLILFGSFLFLSSNVSATCTTGLYNLPCIQLTANVYTNCIGSGATFDCRVILSARTSFDPNLIEVTPCTSCFLRIEDCNGSLIQCDDGLPSTPAWAGISIASSHEGDIICGSSCTRNGVVEDTAFSPRLTSIREGSRYLRACWYDAGVLVNCTEKPIRIHTYPYTGATAAGSDGFCWPDSTPDINLVIKNWNPFISQTCIMSNGLQKRTQVPLVIFVQCNLIIQDSWLLLERTSIEFNAMNTNPGCGRIQVDQNSVILMYSPNGPIFSDHNIVGEDRNKQTIGYNGWA